MVLNHARFLKIPKKPIKKSEEMKKKSILYISLMIIFAGLVSAIIIFKKDDKGLLPLKERTAALAASKEWPATKAKAEGLIKKLAEKPDDIKSETELASIYVEEGRVTGDYSYYNKATLRVVNRILKKEPDNFEALIFKSLVYLNAHRFAEARDIAERARNINPNESFVYGLLCDANVEMGNYDMAVKMADQMNMIKPSLNAYARVSYLREIYGQVPGAIDAMKMAVQAGMPGMEQTAWALEKAGRLYENEGNLDSAKIEYEIALDERPDYAFAMADMGRIEMAKKNYQEAIEDFTKAKDIVADFSFFDALTDLYRLTGNTAKADENAKIVVKMLENSEEMSGGADDIGHNANRELAYAYLKAGQNDKALDRAEAEYKIRPDNIDVDEMMAWTAYKNNKYTDASKYIQGALKTNSANPTLLYRAGLIKIKAGDKDNGMALLNKAATIDPYLSQDLMNEGKGYLTMK